MSPKNTPSKRTAMRKGSVHTTKRPRGRVRKSATKKRSRLEWWPDPDPMPAILKALGSATQRQEFLDRLDYYRDDLIAWLEGEEEGGGPPPAARRLIEKHLKRTDGEFFDEVIVGSDSSDIGFGYAVTLYARRRGKLIHYRSRDDNAERREYAPTKEPLDDDEIADLIGPETACYDYELEAEEIIAGLPDQPSDEEIGKAAEDYASHVTKTKVAAVSELIRGRITSNVRRKKPL